MEESERYRAAVNILCAMLSNQGIVNSAKAAENSKENLATIAFDLVDAVEYVAHDIKMELGDLVAAIKPNAPVAKPAPKKGKKKPAN